MVADLDHVFLLSGTGELIEPDDGIMAVGSGGTYALAAARALYPDDRMEARAIVERSLQIASEICVFTNANVTILEVGRRQVAADKSEISSQQGIERAASASCESA